jgi:hypothetical protein
MVKANNGNGLILFDDLNTGGRRKGVTVTANAFLDYFDPDGSMNSQNNASSVLPGVPILWVAGTREEDGLKRMGALLRGKLPANPANRFVEVNADHLNTPNKAVEPVIAWIREIVQ